MSGTLGPQWDTFLVDVEHDEGRSRVAVSATSTNEATLTALQMVAARGRTPTKATIDWDSF